MDAKRDRPAEIEITQEMIEAGVNAFLDLGELEDIRATSEGLIVAQIFQAMRRAEILVPSIAAECGSVLD